MDKKILLSLLDDQDVKKKILELVDGKQEVQSEKKIFPTNETILYEQTKKLFRPEETDDLKEKIFRLEEENRDLQEKLGAKISAEISLGRQAKELEKNLETLRGEYFKLKKSLAQAEQKTTMLRDDVKIWKQHAEDERERANSLQRELDGTQEKFSALEKSVGELNAQLEMSFARGRELFKKYQGVGSHARQLLQGVFTRENNFMSFICGGAQTDSLETIWDVLRECLMSGRNQDAEILREIFEYCLELVNASKKQASYSLLPVRVGDRFDSDFHSEAPGSRAQGKISAVWLPGYRNDYNGRVFRKSVVQVS